MLRSKALNPDKVKEVIRASRTSDKPIKVGDGHSLYLFARDGSGYWLHEFRDGASRRRSLPSRAQV